uniref:KilA-N domain-containing protein n=1 Tax=Eikenella sp. NML97-A-109 TaxID=1795833 RepID=UPI0009EEEC7B|nr:KilA-N domain-containing protein [Eikenella sp. NML97-A-109]
MRTVSIANITIRQTENLYSLNDLHRASGAENRHKPSLWLKNQQSIDLVDEISKAGFPALDKNQHVIKVVKGGNQSGTFVCKELVYAYATWVSAKFFLQVIRTFDAVISGNLHAPEALPSAQTTIDERRGLVDAVKLLVARCGIDYSAAYRMVHQRFGVAHIDQIAAPLLPSAVAYVHSLMLHNGISSEVLDRLPENMQPKPLRNLQGAVLNSLYCAEFIYQHRLALRGLNRRLAATLNDHAADSIMFLRNVAEQAGIRVPDNEYFQYFPWDGDSAEKASYHQLNA